MPSFLFERRARDRFERKPWRTSCEEAQEKMGMRRAAAAVPRITSEAEPNIDRNPQALN
jgi:adenylate kinase